jgi:hypothetical protein
MVKTMSSKLLQKKTANFKNSCKQALQKKQNAHGQKTSGLDYGGTQF